MPTGSRIVSVADALVALIENRPYRNGLNRQEVLMLLGRMVHNAALDIEILELPADIFEEINSKRIGAQEEAIVEYRHFIRQVMQIEESCDQRFQWLE